MSHFGLITEINEKDPATWEDRLFLTTDIDWACDEVIEFCFDYFRSLNARVTWFTTHETKWNDAIHNNENYLLGLHPNFNPLFHGTSSEKKAEDILKKLMAVIPTTNVIRSHSTTQSSELLNMFAAHNFRYESNMFIPLDSDTVVKPMLYYNGLIKIPYIWSDDVHMAYNWDYQTILQKLLRHKGLRVIDCHPIHIFLNSENNERYIRSKPHHRDFSQLKKLVNNDTYGTRDFLTELITNASSDHRQNRGAV